MTKDHQQPLVSVIVPTCNRSTMLVECLDSILASEYNHVEIIIVDDHSSDDTEERVKTFGDRVKYLKNESTERLIKTRNRGGFEAKGKYFLFADDDNIFHPRMIQVLVNEMERDEKIGVAGPMMYYASNRDLIWWSETFISRWSARTFFPFRNQMRSVITDERKETDGIPNLFMVRNGVFHSIKGFDQSYFNTWTEADFCERIKQLGHKIVRIQDAETYHQVDPKDWGGALTARSMGDNPAKAYTTIRNRYKFVGKYFPLVGRITFLLFFSWALFAYYVFYAVKLKKTEYIPAYFRGLRDGLRIFFGLNYGNA